MALLQLPFLQAAPGGAMLETSRSTSFLSSASHVGVGCDHSSFPSFLGGGYTQSSTTWSHSLRASPGNESISSPQRFSGYGIVALSDSQLSSDRSRYREDGYRAFRSDSQHSSDRSRNREDGYRASRSDSQHSSDSSRNNREDGYRASQSDSARRNDFRPEVSSGRVRQDKNFRTSDFNREVSSGGGRQNGYTSGPRPDSRSNQGNNHFSSQQRSSGRGAVGGGRQNGYATTSSLSSDPRRTHQGSNFNSQRASNDEYNDGGAATRSYSRKSQADKFNSSQTGRQSGYDGERSVASRDRSRGWDARGGQGRGRGGAVKVSGTSRSSRSAPSPLTQSFTPRQSSSQFVSDRTIYRAPWEQGPSSSTWRGTKQREVAEKNPLIERLQRMQEEVETHDAEDDDDEDDADFDNLGPNSKTGFDDEALNGVSREDSAMARMVERLSNIPASRNNYRPSGRGSVGVSDETGSSFGPKHGQPMFPTVGRGWSSPDNPILAPAAPTSQRFRPDTRFPWEREDPRDQAQRAEKLTRVKPPSLAELTLPEDELRRLRSLGILTMHRVKIGKLGVTNSIVDSIHNEWRNSEVVRVKCEGPPAQNMKRTHEALEERTGGLVVWRAGGACLVYRGKDYVPPPLGGVLDFSERSTSSSVAGSQNRKAENEAEGEDGTETDHMEEGISKQTIEPKVIVPRVRSIYDPELEKEMEEILSTLGPRYDDWTGMTPVPVDADLLVGPNFKFKKPFRQLPYGVRPKLSNLELTNLRRLGRPLPPHFVLGVNRNLEGLAAAIVKLWEKSEIAKIAVKRGVQNTNHERMAEHLKRLTGGVLLSRDKYFIVLYRGKDFLPPSVVAALEERQAMTTALQEEEEKARLLPQSRGVSDTSVERSIAGTLAETLEAKANWDRLKNTEEQRKVEEEVRKSKRRDMIRRIQRKVSVTMAKKHKAEVMLQKVEKRLRPAGPPLDRENITDEERHMLSKLGLKMHAFLLLGRRGVFDGTVENMHLHWKHRPLVKIIYKARDRLDLEQTARMLEYESGGILVATIPTNKGQAIMVYRGKNYQRPPELRPRTLLTKRQALKRSIEMQRKQSLMKHLLTLEKEIEDMQADLSKLGEEDEERHEEDEEDEKEGDGELHEPTASDLVDFQEETKDLTTSELKYPDEKGRSKVLAGLARAIRIHFRKHALVKVGVRGKSESTPVEEIHQLEEATGGTLVSDEHSKVILYRGWPEGQETLTEETGRWEELPPQLRSAMITEVEADEDYLHESDWDESDDEDYVEDEESGADVESEDYFESRAIMDDLEANDDSDRDEFEEDDNEGYLENELDLGLQEEDADDEDEDEDEEFANEGYLKNELDLGLQEEDKDDEDGDKDKEFANAGYLESELDLRLQEEDEDKDEEELAKHAVVVNDAV